MKNENNYFIQSNKMLLNVSARSYERRKRTPADIPESYMNKKSRMEENYIMTEKMFSERKKPWSGLGTVIEEATDSKTALEMSCLDWNVIQKNIETSDGDIITGYKANVRETDNAVLGIVSDRYKVVQNMDAFSFTDALLGEGVRYEIAGSLQNGRRTWILVRLPHQYIINGDEITPYLIVMNSHDGSGSIKVAMTPVRVVCSNTLNFALAKAKRSWSMVHTGDISTKLDEAKNTLIYAGNYMAELGKNFAQLEKIKLSDSKILDFINELIPENEGITPQQRRNILRLREDMKQRYFDAPDLMGTGKNAYRFINAVSDFATHAKPLRERSNYRENLFAKTVDGNPMIDKAYQMVMAA